MRRHKPKKVLDFSWTPELAYAVGLLTTDGCLSSDARHAMFVSKDIEQITNLQVCLGLKSSLGFTRNSKSEAYKLTFSNVQMYDWLLKAGLTPKKSLTLGAINIPDPYFVDFLRGHLDGDGSITSYTDLYNTKIKSEYIYERISVRFISASQKHILWLHKKIVDLIGIKGAIHSTKVTGNRNPIFVIKFGKKESLKLLSRLYYNDTLPCLSRKRSVYTNFIKKI